MPLPFLIVGAVWAGAAVAANKSQKQVKNKVEECNHIWDEIEKISNSSKNLAEARYNNYCWSVERIDKLRENIFHGTITGFVDAINKIENTRDLELSDDLKSLPIISNNTNVTKYSASEHQVNRSNAFASPVLATGVAVAFGAIGGGIMFAEGKIKKAKIQGEIDKANTELSKVKSEAEKVRYRCSQLDNASSKLNLYHKTFSELNKLASSGVQHINYIIETEGSDYRMYSVETRKELMAIIKLNKLLRAFVKENIVDYKGDIRRDTENRHKECVKLLQETDKNFLGNKKDNTSSSYEGSRYCNDSLSTVTKKHTVNSNSHNAVSMIGDKVKIRQGVKRFWSNFDRSSRVGNVPKEFFNYTWLIVGSVGDKYEIRHRDTKIVLMSDDIYLG